MDSTTSKRQTSRFRRLPETTRRFLYLIAGLVILAVISFFGARPWYAKIKARQAVERAGAAKTLLANKQYTEALDVLQNALHLAPGEPEVLRQLGRLSKEIGFYEGLTSWQILLGTPAATLEDRLDYIEMALNYHKVDVSGTQLGAIIRTNTTNPRVLNLLIRHLQALGKPEAAIIAARAWTANDVGNLDAQLKLGSLLAESTEEAERAEGRRLLLSLAIGKTGPIRDQAVDKLARSPGLSPAEGQLMLKALAERPGTEMAQAEVELTLDPIRRGEIMSAMVRRAQAATNDAQLRAYARWIGGHGGWRQVPELLPEDKVESKPELLDVRLEALINSDRLNEVMPYLQMATPPVAPYLFHCLKAHAAQKQNKIGQIRTHFDNAIAAAGNDGNQLIAIANYAERLGATDAAITAYQRLMQNPSTVLPAANSILRLVENRKDLSTQRDTYRKMAALFPRDAYYSLNSAYLGFLMGESQPEIRASLAQSAVKHPDQPLFVLVQALGELRAGKNTDALSLLEGLKNFDWDKTEPRWLALYAAVLGANQQREAARLMASKVDVTTLKLQEEELIKPWR